MKLFMRIILLGVICFPSLGESALEQELFKFDDIWKLGLANNSEVIKQKARIGAARVNAIASVFSGLSQPDLQLEYPAISRDLLKYDSIEIQQALSLSGLFQIDTLIAFDQLGVEKALLLSQQGQLYSDLRRIYASIIIACKEAEVASENVALLRQLSVKMQIQYQTGKITKSDLLQVAIELRQAEQTSLELINREKVSRSELNMLLGLSLDTELKLDDSISELGFELPLLSQITNKILRSHPEIRQSTLTRKAAQKSLWKEVINIIPAPFAGVRRVGSDTSFVFGATLPLWDLNLKNIAQSAAENKISRISLAQVRKETLFKIHTAYLKASSARQNLDTLKSGLEDALELIKTVSLRYRENEIDLYKYLANIRTANEARLRFYQGILDYDIAISDLEQAMHTSLRAKEYL